MELGELNELKLLRGREVSIDDVGILKPIIIDELVDIGEKIYYQYLNNLCFDIDNLNITREEKQELETQNITPYHLIVSRCTHDDEYRNLIIEAFQFFFREEVLFADSIGIFIIGGISSTRFINIENFENIRQVLRLQNGLSKNDVLDENPKDEKTRILLEKRRKAREKLAKAKSKDNGDTEPITFADLVSIMCANANGVNHENVWYMNIYMFQNQFQRLKLMDDYDISIRSLLAGADPNEIDLKHYMSHL